MSNKISTWQVLRNKFPEAEYVLIEEVSDASGFARSRSLDFMVINLWQSRGLAVTGIERKSNRGDWLKEMKNPAKQENHFKYCDYFYLLTDKENVAKIEEIPDSWGWYHITENGTLKTMKQAPKLEAQPIGRSLMCAMLRRAADKGKYVHIDSLTEKIAAEAERIQTSRNDSLERRAAAYDSLKENVDAFERASGIRISYSWNGDVSKMGEAVRAIMSGEASNYVRNLQSMEQRVADIHKGLKDKIAALSKALEQLTIEEQKVA